MIETYKGFLEEKENIFQLIQKHVADDVLYCSCVGSFVYRFEDLYSSVKSNDIDVLCVVKTSNKINSKSNKNLHINYRGVILDIQVIEESRFNDLLIKQHLFYLESLFTPEYLIFKSANYLKKFKFNQSAFETHMYDNREKTTKRAKKSFEDSDYIMGKKYIAHLIRIEDFATQLQSTGKINLRFHNDFEDLMDDSPIGFDDFLDILQIDKKTKFKI